MNRTLNQNVINFALGGLLIICSQSLFADTDNSAEMDSMAAYLAAGMACASVTETISDNEVHEKILGLVTNLTNKTYFYTETERELIQEKALKLSATLASQDDIEGKCLKLADNL